MVTVIVAKSEMGQGVYTSMSMLVAEEADMPWDSIRVEAAPGVVRVKQIRSGVAVIAKDFWTAKTAADALAIEWDDGPRASVSTEALGREYRALAETAGLVAEEEGSTEAALGTAAKTLEAVYEVPYLAHAPMEPLNAVAHVRADRCEIWAGTQGQTFDQLNAAEITGLRPDQIDVHTTLVGGGFGRRANFTSDFVADAVEVAKGEGVPVKTVWSREDDIQCGYFRPMFVHKVRAGVDASGRLVAWHQRMVGQAIVAGTAWESIMKNGIDSMSVEGATHMPYAIPHRRIEIHNAQGGPTVLWMRSVSHGHTAFVNETFLDEIAHATGQEPLELRRALLENQPRHRRVLELAAEKAGWGTPPPEVRRDLPRRGRRSKNSFPPAAWTLTPVWSW